MKINEHYQELNQSYLFSTIAVKVKAFRESNPDADLIRLGIGDVTLPLCDAVVSAMSKATLEMGRKESFKGYGPEQGYEFLKRAVAQYYTARQVVLDETEIFISDGAKSDLGNILDLFAQENTVLIPNPVYPVYVDTNIMAGRKIIYADANEENSFLPMPDERVKADIIYLCSPNNPTGAVYNRCQLQAWVDYAKQNQAVILYDAAYEAFVGDTSLPKSIYEVIGAKDCAIEFCSLSKTAGFTGTRCGYTILPLSLKCGDISLNKLWMRRQTTKFNGVPYIVQCGAAAVFSEEGQKQVQTAISYYKKNAALLAATLRECNIWFVGGEHSPYIWLKCKEGMSSWEFFDYLLEQAHLVGTPGSGFGKNGEGYFRLTGFGDYEQTAIACERIKVLLKCN